MMGFNMGSVQTAKVVSNNFLKAGIHDVIFKGIDKSETLNAMELRFEAVDGSGIHIERLFEPTSAERTESQFGTNPSMTEQFMCKVKQVIDALDPELARNIESDGSKFQASSFEKFIALVKAYLDKKVGAKTQIKLVPTTGNYVGFPGFIARISKDGNLYMTTKIIGDNLVLTPAEKTKIDSAANAKPTDMRAKTNELDDLANDFGASPVEDENDDLGLPF